MSEPDSSLHSQINVGINEFNEMTSQLKEILKIQISEVRN
jgi:hypothetical protein